MNLKSILESKKFTVSFEVFPPKDTDSYESIKAATDKIAALSPLFMSVTYGAGGGTRRFTLDIAQAIQEKYNVPTLAHLTCVGATRDSIKDTINEMKSRNITNVMALRGDIPAGTEKIDTDAWDYKHAVDLIREIRESGNDFCIGGACYPEIHPESSDQREDIKYLKEKVDAGCDFLTTQMFFDNSLFYNFLFKIRDAGIDVPVVPGIMPITKGFQLKRALTLSGSFIPQRFKTIVDRFGNDHDAMKQAGIAYATAQIIDLFANGIYHVHIYTMNKPDVAESILTSLSSILGKEI